MGNDLREVLEKGVFSFVPSGNSMRPFLNGKNQSVIIEKKSKRLSLYDVGLYLRKNNSFVLHRVIKVNKDGYVFQGDSQFYTEEIKEDDVIGIMIGYYRKKKYIDCNSDREKKRVEKYVKGKYRKKIYCYFFFKSNSLKNKIKKLFRCKNV